MELASSGDTSGQGGAGPGRLRLLGTVTDSYLLRAVATLGSSQSLFHETGTAHRGRSPSSPGTGEAQAPEAGPGLPVASDGALSSSTVPFRRRVLGETRGGTRVVRDLVPGRHLGGRKPQAHLLPDPRPAQLPPRLARLSEVRRLVGHGPREMQVCASPDPHQAPRRPAEFSPIF